MDPKGREVGRLLGGSPGQGQIDWFFGQEPAEVNFRHCGELPPVSNTHQR